MATIALFSGQGSQYEKMGLDLVQQDAVLEEIFEVASEVLGFDLYAVIADSDAQTLAHTIYAQPAIMATSLICLEAAKKRGFTYDAVAGHSLGEYAAMVASGMLSLEDGFRVIKARSEAMDAAAKAADGAMCAILKLAPAEVERICQETEGYVSPANYNSSVQTVIAGDSAAAQAAADPLAGMGFRATKLAVSSAFHSKLMAGAAEEFSEAIAGVRMNPLCIPFYSNLTGHMLPADADLHEYLVKHLISPVHFHEEVRGMVAEGINLFIELGPNKVLTSLIKRGFKQVSACNVEKPSAVEKLKETL